MTEIIQPDSLVTLHYRLSLENGAPMLSTFESRPATLQLGRGELLPQLEARLIGLGAGTRHTFHLSADEAFGTWRPERVQRIGRDHLPEDVTDDDGIVALRGADGSNITGVIRELDNDGALVDFNHPLSGRNIHFEVHIIGIL